MLQALARIQNVWMRCPVEFYNEKKQKIIEGRAFVITDRMGQLRLDGFVDVEKFIFRPGRLFGHFLAGPGRQIALLSAKALEYDFYRQRWEKRLARYLSWHWRTQALGGDYIHTYRVSTLLKAVGAKLNEDRPHRTRERLEKTLDTLRDDGVTAGWQYERWHEPEPHARRWAKVWLQTSIAIEAPEIIKTQYTRIGGHNELLTAESLAGQIIDRRRTLRLTQMQAAEQIGISNSLLSRIESGKQKPSARVRGKVDAWLR